MTFNPYAPPKAVFIPSPARPATVLGDRLVLPSGHPLPPLCIKCGCPDSLVPREHTFRHRPAWSYFILLIGLIPGIILLNEITKKATVILPLCSPCHARWGKGMLFRVFAAWGPIVSLVIAMFVAAATDWLPLYGIAAIVFLPATILAPILVRFLVTPSRMLVVDSIDEQALTLRGVAQPVLSTIATGIPGRA